MSWEIKKSFTDFSLFLKETHTTYKNMNEQDKKLDCGFTILENENINTSPLKGFQIFLQSLRLNTECYQMFIHMCNTHDSLAKKFWNYESTAKTLFYKSSEKIPREETKDHCNHVQTEINTCTISFRHNVKSSRQVLGHKQWFVIEFALTGTFKTVLALNFVSNSFTYFRVWSYWARFVLYPSHTHSHLSHPSFFNLLALLFSLLYPANHQLVWSFYLLQI